MAQKYSTQICRFDAKGCFFEALTTSFAIGKLQLSFANYDEKTGAMNNKLDFYLDIWEALGFCETVLSGRFDAYIKECKAKGYVEGMKVDGYSSYFHDIGGVNFHKNGVFDKARFDTMKSNFAWLDEKKDLSREFKVQESTKYKYMFRGEYGLGNTQDNGLIARDGAPKIYIQIPLTEKQINAFAASVKCAILAYQNQYYMKFQDELFKNQKCNVFTPNKKA